MNLDDEIIDIMPRIFTPGLAKMKVKLIKQTILEEIEKRSEIIVTENGLEGFDCNDIRKILGGIK